MRMVRVLIQLPRPLKAKLDAECKRGTTAAGLLRHLLEQHFKGKEAAGMWIDPDAGMTWEHIVAEVWRELPPDVQREYQAYIGSKRAKPSRKSAGPQEPDFKRSWRLAETRGCVRCRADCPTSIQLHGEDSRDFFAASAHGGRIEEVVS